MDRALPFLVLATLIGAGCLGGAEPAPKATVTKAGGARPYLTAAAPGLDATEARTVIHGADLVLLSNASLPGELPVVEQRYVGTINGVEPTVAVGPKGTAYYVGIDNVLAPQVYRTRDLGRSWQDVTPKLGGAIEFPPFTNDPFIHADPITGRVFSVDLSLTVDCSTVWISDNEGDSWQLVTTDTCAVSRQSHDHQSLVTGIPVADVKPTGYANLVYYCVNRGQALCATSLDGGRTFGPMVPTGLRSCGGLTGHVQTAPDGTAYLPQIACGTQVRENWIKVAISRDGGRSWSVVNVSKDFVPARNFTSTHEGNIDVDAAGNVYYFFLDKDHMPALSISRDAGRTWSEPRVVAVPGLTAATLASIAAGDKGRIALLYIGTTAPGGHQPRNPESATWNAYISYSFNALDEWPVFVTTTANPLSDPLKRGTCSGRCMGAGVQPAFTFYGMYDFLDIDIDPQTGRVWAALVDLCNGPCAQSPSGTSNEQTGRAAVAVQTGGPSLRVLGLGST